MSAIDTFRGPAAIDMDRVSKADSNLTRTLYSLQLWSVKALVRSSVLWTRHVKGLAVENRPTYTKLYPSSRGIRAQVYLPKDYKSGDALLPLLIDVHGGGFCIGAPLHDAPDNASFAHKHGFAVVSVGYRLGPSHPFPACVHDVADQIKNILDDEDLPIDRNRVAVIGYSAGGNLALTAVQLHRLQDRIRASVAYYPAVDFVVTINERNRWRVPHPDGRADVLGTSAHFFTWGYIPAGTELRQPLLSPRFAPRDKLPNSLYILGCEYDMLCHEAWTMAEELAAKQGIPKTEDTRGGDQGWESGTLRWKRAMGVEHGFNLPIPPNSGSDIADYQRKADDCQVDVVEWLHRVAFSQAERIL